MVVVYLLATSWRSIGNLITSHSPQNLFKIKRSVPEYNPEGRIANKRVSLVCRRTLQKVVDGAYIHRSKNGVPVHDFWKKPPVDLKIFLTLVNLMCRQVLRKFIYEASK